MSDLNHVRNFSIIAHVDHDKSTLTDRSIRMCGGLSDREMEAQVLGSMDLERECGTTIKAHSVTLHYKTQDGKTYQFNSIDTPGYVDFTYEVSRSLTVYEGTLLVVDAGQDIETQSVANYYTAIEQGLEVMSVLSKMDPPQAESGRVKEEIESIIDINAIDIMTYSVKNGMDMLEVLERLVTATPAPEDEIGAPLRALIIDSWFSNYLGVASLVWVRDSRVKKSGKTLMKPAGKVHQADSVGVFTPKHTETVDLKVGEMGFIIAGIKSIHGTPVGDTLTLNNMPGIEALPGLKRVKSQVYTDLSPVSSDDLKDFCDTLQRPTLNDSLLQYEPESFEVLGFGFRCGFLGILYMEIIQERLKREYDLDLITTVPMVVFEIVQKNGEITYVDSLSKLPGLASIQEIREPIYCTAIPVSKDHLGNVIILCIGKCGMQRDIHLLSGQVQLVYDLPMNGVVPDFFDRPKSTSRGYASLDYNFDRFEPFSPARPDALTNGEKVDASAPIVHRGNAPYKGRQLVKKMKKLIPRQMFNMAIQAAIGGQIITCSMIRMLRRNVLAKCYGGSVSRKRKLLERWKVDKKRMKQVGSVEVPQEAFLATPKMGSQNP